MDPAFAYVITGDTKYADIVRRTLLALCQAESWTYPKYSALYRFGHHILNISAMQHGTAAAFAYDCIANTLTEDEKEYIKQRVLEESYAPMFDYAIESLGFHNRNAGASRGLLFVGRLLADRAPGLERLRRRVSFRMLGISEQGFLPDSKNMQTTKNQMANLGSYLFNSGQNLLQKSSKLGFC